MEQRLFIIMGVAGSGKSSIGLSVAEKLGGTYIDGDDFHPQSNIDKMASGQPLNDDDRWPWLKIVTEQLSKLDGLAIAGCSALKKSYRNFISEHASEAIQFIYLDGSKELISKRMSEREGHFMPTSLLDSQFKTLEVPDETENHISVEITGTQEQVVNDICIRIQAQNRRTI